MDEAKSFLHKMFEELRDSLQTELNSVTHDYSPGLIRSRLQAAWHDRESRRRALRSALLFLCIFTILYGVGIFMPVGFDWVHYYSQGLYPAFWMPWSKPIVDHLNLPAVFALTMTCLLVRIARYRPSAAAIFLMIFSLPVFWLWILGTLDGLAIFGLLILPLGAPFVLIKPQVASFALLARWRSLVVVAAWLLISFAIWGFWSKNLMSFSNPQWWRDWPQDISLFPWGLILALPLMWFSRGDEDLLMAAGSLGTPHLFPYHFIVLMPALARMRWPWMLLTWVITWTPLLSNWLGPWAWHFGNLASLCFWFGIYLNRDRLKLNVPAGPPLAFPAPELERAQ